MDIAPNVVLNDPASVIQTLWKKKQPTDVRDDFGVKSFFKKFVEDHKQLIPTLSPGMQMPAGGKAPGKLVRLVCMIQDTMADEVYITEYTMISDGNKSKERRCNKFCQLPQQEPGVTFEMSEKFCQRKRIWTVMIPGLSDWAAAECGGEPSAAIRKGWKSPLDCMVKLEEGEDPKVTEMWEFVGVWAPASIGGEAGWDPHVLNCLYQRKLHPSFPCIPPLTTAAVDQDLAVLQSLVGTIRTEIIDFMSSLLPGKDRLLAEYILLHCLAKVSGRREETILGTFSLQIGGCPAFDKGGEDLGKTIVDLYKVLRPRVTTVNLSIEECNKTRYVPVKNHVTEELSLSVLQVPQQTILVVNETGMGEGELKDKGVLNIRDLAQLVDKQKLEYDFEFHGVPFETDTSVAMLTERKVSLLGKSGVLIMLKKEEAGGEAGGNPELDALFDNHMQTDPPAAESVAERLQKINTASISMWRKFISLSRELQSRVTYQADVSKFAELNWVKMRKEQGSEAVGPEVLHNRMTLSRLYAMSHAKLEVTVDVYNQVRLLEESRMARIPKTPKSTTAKE